jgi:hypothetical protein
MAFGFTAVTTKHDAILYFIIFSSSSLKNHLDLENTGCLINSFAR